EYTDPIAHFRAEAKRLTDEGRSESSFEIPANLMLDPMKRRRVMLGYIFPQSVYYSLGLDMVMRGIRNESKATYDFNRIMRDLVIGRVLSPLSKSSTYEKAFSFPESPDYDLQHVYRSLSLMAKNFDLIEEKAFKGMKKYADVDTSVTYYDCTNFYFEIEEEDGFRTYGKSKENRPNPIVQMGIFLDRNGLPISMCINPGRTNEQKTMIPLEKLMTERLGIEKFVVCADCGLSGKRNLRFNSTENHGFVVTKSLKKVSEDVRARLMGDGGWKRFGDASGRLYSLKEIREDANLRDVIFYHDEKFAMGSDGFEERIVTTYCGRLREYQRSVRERQLQRAMELVRQGKIRKGINQNDVRRFIVVDSVTENGEVAEKKVFSIDRERFEEESEYDGFYAVTTDLDDDPGEIIRINRGRWEIEESFRIMKSDFDGRPVFVSREDRIRAHFLTCYLAFMIFRIIEQKLNKGDVRYTDPEILRTLRDYEAIDAESFYVGAMEGKAVRALESTFGLVGSMTAFSKAQFRRLVARSKKEKI
ncbi:MAG: IS1634 family transposase, partial [Candidatus Enterosoma sp.]|nr:IS1634 family transposase [Candidatus Enterosoma sp.]